MTSATLPASNSCFCSARAMYLAAHSGRCFRGADVQRICLFDTWLSSVVVGRSVATVAEICFAAQWAIILHQLGTMTGSGCHRLERRVGDRTADPRRGMLFMACGAHHQLSRQRHRKFDLGRCLPRRRDWLFADCYRSSMVRFAWSSPFAIIRDCRPIWRFS